MKKLLTIWMLLVAFVAAKAQMMDPVHFTTQMKDLKNGEAELVFKATIDAGWHVYSTGLGNDGPISASFHKVKMDGAEPVGKLQARGKEIKQFDKLFEMEVRYFEQAVTFVQKIKFTKPKYDIDCYIEYGACNDQACLPPSEVQLKAAGTSSLAESQPEQQLTSAAEASATCPSSSARDSSSAAEIGSDNLAGSDSLATTNLWAPVVSELQAFNGNAAPTENMALWLIFIEGLLGGFIALFTPCVWPIIPMTVSFFLRRNKDRSKAIREAATYGASIVVIYVLLGLAVTLLFGASALNALATNAVFNIFFCLLLVVFAASFLGAFEITLPASWSTKIDEKSESTTGLLSIFLMAFTLALVSFSCTGPIIGFLLVAVSTQGSIVAPTIGMLGFAIALAIPFTLFAMFPSLLKSAPKSGGWMNAIKVTLGFIELAFALKFPHDDDKHRTNVPQFFLAMASLAFTIYMIPGLWGAPLKAISAFAPPMSTQDFNLQKTVTEAKYKDYEQGMAAAKAEHKPVIIDFTGFGCVNCRKMEAAVWSDPQVADILNNKYILISLYVDDKTPLDTPIEVEENGQKRTLRTVGDKWSYLQRVKFGANAQPFYVLLNEEGHPLAGSRSYDEDIQGYIDFLNKGLAK